MYLIYLITSIILILIVKKQAKNLFNPIIIYVVIWLFVVSIYNLKLLPYRDTAIETWLLIIFVPIFIWIGYSSLHLITPNLSTKPILNPSKLIYLELFLYIFGSLVIIRTFTVWLGIYFRFGSFFAAFTNGEMIYNMSRSGEWAPGIGFFIPVDLISIFLAGIYHKLRGKLNLFVLIVLISTLFLHLGLQSRFAMLMNFTIYFGGYMGANNAQINIKLSKVIKYFFLGIILISIISFSRNLGETNNLSGEWGDYDQTFLPSIYYYLTNGIAGLNEYVMIGKDESELLYTFNPFLYLYSLIDTSIIVNIYETKNDILDRSEVLVGHGGSCPGYKTQLTIDPEGKKAFIVLINARGVTPSKYTRGIKNLMDQLKQKNNKKSNLFDEISGYYKSLPWNTESYLSSWGENIALISLPTNSANITRFKPIEKDVFRRILKNNDLGEYLYILRDEKNSIIGFKRHQNIYNFYGKEASDLN